MDEVVVEQAAIVKRVTGYTQHHIQGRKWLDAMRTAHLHYPTEPLFRILPIQVNYNRREEGMPVGCFADVQLTGPIEGKSLTKATTATTLLSDVVGTDAVVIVAGSLT